MTSSRRVAFLAALALLVAAALVGTTDRSAAETAKAPRLAAFGSCGQLLTYAKSNAGRFVGPYGLGSLAKDSIETARGAAPPKQGVDFSGTNVQEEGVDEPDIVKTDGNTVYAVANGRLNAVDVRNAKPLLLDSIALDPAMNHELLLHGDRLMVLSRGGYWIEPLPAIAARMAPFQPAQSTLSEINVSDPKRLRPVRTLTLDGSYVAARLVGGSVRIVTSAQVPSKLPFVQPTTGTKENLAATTKKNRAVVASSRVRSWLPTLPDQASRGEGRAGAPARPVPQGAPLARVLRPRHAHRAHGRSREGARARRLGRGDDGRPDRLRLAREPLRRHRALGRPSRSRQADDGQERRPHRDPQVRHLQPAADAVPRQRRRRRLSAQPVVALRAQGRPARRQHREPGVVGRPRPGRVRVVPDDAALERHRSRPGGPDRRARQGRARLRGADDRRHRLRRHVQADRPALHGRSRRSPSARACSAS